MPGRAPRMQPFPQGRSASRVSRMFKRTPGLSARSMVPAIEPSRRSPEIVASNDAASSPKALCDCSLWRLTLIEASTRSPVIEYDPI